MKTLFCGPESFAPDLAPLVGEAPELRNYFVAAGLNSIGILTGPGVGRTVANWIVDGAPDVDVTGVNVDRTKDYQRAPAYREARVAEALGEVYKCHYPFKTPQSGRPALRMPLHDALEKAGAQFRAVSGWEAPDWFGSEQGPLTWGRPAFFENWAEEHAAVREKCGLIDMSFMSKFAVAGPPPGAVAAAPSRMHLLARGAGALARARSCLPSSQFWRRSRPTSDRGSRAQAPTRRRCSSASRPPTSSRWTRWASRTRSGCRNGPERWRRTSRSRGCRRSGRTGRAYCRASVPKTPTGRGF